MHSPSFLSLCVCVSRSFQFRFKFRGRACLYWELPNIFHSYTERERDTFDLDQHLVKTRETTFLFWRVRSNGALSLFFLFPVPFQVSSSDGCLNCNARRSLSSCCVWFHHTHTLVPRLRCGMHVYGSPNALIAFSVSWRLSPTTTPQPTPSTPPGGIPDRVAVRNTPSTMRPATKIDELAGGTVEFGIWGGFSSRRWSASR